jgi:hypothetical protein
VLVEAVCAGASVCALKMSTAAHRKNIIRRALSARCVRLVESFIEDMSQGDKTFSALAATLR